MKKLTVILLALSMAAGCTTTRTYESVSASSAERVEPGKSAVIEFVDGSSEKVEIRHYGVSSLDVTYGDGTAQSIGYDEIRAIHAKKLHRGKTAGAIVGVVAIVGLLSALDGAAFFPDTAPSF